MASASVDATVQVWEVTTGHLRCSYDGNQFGYAGGVTWSPDGKRLASAGEKGCSPYLECGYRQSHIWS